MVRLPALAVAGASLLALAAPGVASAHLRIGTLAVDFRVRVIGALPTTGGAFTVSATNGDRALHLTVRNGHKVVVLGYLGEPMVRADGRGVAVNPNSPTAEAAGLIPKGNPSRRELTRDGWILEVGGRSAVWRDPRLQRLPSDLTRAVWTVPILVDGRRAQIRGELRRARSPSLLTWLIVVLGCASTGVLAGIGPWRRRLWMACFVLGCLAAFAALLVATGFAFDAEASGMRVAAVYELLLALGGVGFAIWGPAEIRIVASAWLGLLGLIGGLACGQVFLHGAVLSSLPGVLTRSGAALATGLGAASVLAGLLQVSHLDAGALARTPLVHEGRREAIRTPR